MKYITIATIAFLLANIAFGNIVIGANLWHAFVATMLVVWVSTIFIGGEADAQ